MSNLEQFKVTLCENQITFHEKNDLIIINHQGNVDLRSLTTENIIYMGQKLHIKTIDGYTMILQQKRKIGESIVYKAKYFGGGSVENLTDCFLANKGNHWAHGKTSREAIEDIRFKVMSADFDKEGILSEIRKTQRVKVNHYRLLTGACKEGCRQFLTSKNLAEETESLPLKHVIEIIPGHYGSATALLLLQPLLKKGGSNE